MNMKTDTRPEKPDTSCDFSALPGQLKDGSLKSFILWRAKWVAERGAWTKPPISDGWQMETNQYPLAKVEGLYQSANVEELTQGVGLALSKRNRFVILDLDGVDPHLLNFIVQNPTYIEQSPSWGRPDKGQFRYHAIYQLPSTDVKSRLKGKRVIKMSNGRQVEVFISTGYCCMTGRPATELGTLCVDKVAKIPMDGFLSSWPECADNPREVAELQDSQPALFTKTVKGLPSISDWASAVSCDKYNPTVERVMLERNMTYEEYWRACIGGLYAYAVDSDTPATVDEAYAAAHVFSSSAGEAYDQGEVDSYWKQFLEPNDAEVLASGADRLGIGTYRMVWSYFNIVWPERGGAKGEGAPVGDAPENFRAFLRFARVEFKVDRSSGVPYLEPTSGKLSSIFSDQLLDYDETTETPAVLGKFYRDVYHWMGNGTDQYFYLAATITAQMRALGCKTKSKYIKDLLEEAVIQLDPGQRESRLYKYLRTGSRRWKPGDADWISKVIDEYVLLDTAYHSEIGPEDAFGKSFSAGVARKIIRIWLRALVRSLIPASRLYGSHAQGTFEMLMIFMGTGSTNKSSFFRRLLPVELRESHWFKVEKGRGSIAGDKDIQKILAGRLIGEHDEVDRRMNKESEGDMKAFMALTMMIFRPAFFKNEVVVHKSWADGGSTNETQLRVPKDGARRYFILHVERLRTMLMDKEQGLGLFDQWGLLSQLIHEVEAESAAKPSGRAPWMPSRELEQVIVKGADKAGHESDSLGVLSDTFSILDQKGRLNKLVADFDGVSYSEISKWAQGLSSEVPARVQERWLCLSLPQLKSTILAGTSVGINKLKGVEAKDAISRWWGASLPTTEFGQEGIRGASAGRRFNLTRGGEIETAAGRTKYLILKNELETAAVEDIT